MYEVIYTHMACRSEGSSSGVRAHVSDVAFEARSLVEVGDACLLDIVDGKF